MKKPSFKPAAVSGFFVRHGEKLLCGLLGLLGVFMIWRGIDTVRSQSVDRSRTPEAVAELARQAAASIERSQQLPRGRLPDVPPLAPRVDPWRPQQVKIADGPTGGAMFNRPLYAELTKRTTPEVFPITDLRAVSGIAVLPDPNLEAADKPPPAGRPELAPPPEPLDPGRPARGPRGRGRNRDQAPGTGIFGAGDLAGPASVSTSPEEPLPPGKITPFIVVTGLIPAARQREEYASRFGSVSFRDPRRDVPSWSEYIVERTRVVEGASPRWERLKLVNVERRGMEAARPGVRNLGDRGADGPALAPETIPGGFLLQPDEAELDYAAPLPARIDEPWGELAVHPWFIPQLKERLAGKSQQRHAGQDKVAEITLAELVAKPLEFIGRELRLTNVALEAAPERQPNVGLYRFGVRAVKGEEAATIGPIGLVETAVFASSEELGRKLGFDMVGEPQRACNLVVRVDLMGKTPVARLLEIELLDADGGVAGIRTETNPGPAATKDAAGLAALPLQPGGGAVFAGPRAENRLFRFVDTAVEPGAVYRYRVRFALRNPNVRLSPQHVADAKVAQGEFLVSASSNETAPVRVPAPVRLLVRTMPRDAARRLKVKGDAVEVMVLGESNESGNFALRSVVTGPGGLADIDPGLNRAGDVRFYGEPLATGRLLVGVRGQPEERADSRSPLAAEPLEMLFSRPDGSFEIAAAADSERLIQKYRSSLFKPGEDVPEDARPDARVRDTSPWSRVEAAEETRDYGLQIRDGKFEAAQQNYVRSIVLPQLALPGNRTSIVQVRQRIRDIITRGATAPKVFDAANALARDFMVALARDEAAEPILRVNAMLLVGELQAVDRKPWAGGVEPLAAAVADEKLPLAVRIAAVTGLSRQAAEGRADGGFVQGVGPALEQLVARRPTGDPAASSWIVGQAVDLLGVLGSSPAAKAAMAGILADDKADLDLRIRAAATLGRQAKPADKLDAAALTGTVRSVARSGLERDLSAAQDRRLSRQIAAGIAGEGQGVPGGAAGRGMAAPGGGRFAGEGMFGGLPADDATEADEDAVLPLACLRNAWRLTTLADAVQPAQGSTGLVPLLQGDAAAEAIDLATMLRQQGRALLATPDEATLEKALKLLKSLQGAARSAGPAPTEDGGAAAAGADSEGNQDSPFPPR